MPIATRADSTLQLSINVPILDELRNVLEVNGYSWSLLPDDPNNIKAN